RILCAVHIVEKQPEMARLIRCGIPLGNKDQRAQCFLFCIKFPRLIELKGNITVDHFSVGIDLHELKRMLRKLADTRVPEKRREIQRYIYWLILPQEAAAMHRYGQGKFTVGYELSRL